MKKIVIIGGGIIGLTLANYLDSSKFEITLFEDGQGQATGASAGIISPWLSKRRNKKWYQLAKDGAAFFPKLVSDLNLTTDIYSVCGTLILRDEDSLDSLAQLAEERKKEAPEIGDIQLLTPKATQNKLPLLQPLASLAISGGSRLNGRAYLAQALKLAIAKGVTVINEKAQLEKNGDHWLVTSENHQQTVDYAVITAGAFAKPLLENIGYQIDIRPQKGQLLSWQTPFKESLTWPVAMLDGEADLIPFQHGKIMIGATHENDAGWDLTPTSAAANQLINGTQKFLTSAFKFSDYQVEQLVGTRAYTNDFAPFFGSLISDSSLVVASGLGSSGLTTGPYIGYLLAQSLNGKKYDTTQYQKPIDTYIKTNL